LIADRKGSSQQDAIGKVVEELSNQDRSSQVPVDGFGLLGNGIVCKEVETKCKTLEKRRDMKRTPSCISTSKKTNVPLFEHSHCNHPIQLHDHAHVHAYLRHGAPLCEDNLVVMVRGGQKRQEIRLRAPWPSTLRCTKEIGAAEQQKS
jgi:hypothetical protein